MTIAYTPSLFTPPANLTLADCRVRRTRSYTLAASLVARWHSVLPHSPAGMRVAFVVVAGPLPIAVSMWGRPSARLEDQVTTLELTRQAHGPHCPRNLGTWFLARQRRWIRENMPDIVRLISYQDADVHHGTLYRADNWSCIYERHTEHTWQNRPGRRAVERQHKIKWERIP